MFSNAVLEVDLIMKVCKHRGVFNYHITAKQNAAFHKDVNVNGYVFIEGHCFTKTS